MEEINGFKIVPLHVRPLSRTHHTLFLKAHEVRKEDAQRPAKRTLFVLNVPPYITEQNLNYGFQKVGEVSHVLFQDNVNSAGDADKFTATKPRHGGFKVAYVVFQSTKSLKKALELDQLCLYDDETKELVVETGVNKWVANFINSVHAEDDLQAEIDTYMAGHDKKERASRVAEKNGQADDEGWMTVTKRGPVAGFEQKESVINKVEERMEKRRKQKELTNFYTFQIRESKMKHIVSLRKKFEEDKQKIDRLKLSRRFNPFEK